MKIKTKLKYLLSTPSFFPCSTSHLTLLFSSLRSLLWHHLCMGCILLQDVSSCSSMESYMGCRWMDICSIPVLLGCWRAICVAMVLRDNLWSSARASREPLLFLPGASPPLPSLALVSEGAVSLIFTHSSFSQLLQSFFTRSWICYCRDTTSTADWLIFGQ